MTEELKPCPFCGKNNHNITCYNGDENYEDNPGFYFIECQSCGAHGGISDAMDLSPREEERIKNINQAILIWETRAPKLELTKSQEIEA